jgi:tetratricopeptide (TPR) repeat protein
LGKLIAVIVAHNRGNCCIGSAYYDLGNYPKAIEYHQHHLDIARQIGDREGEAAALCNLGNTQSELQRYAEAWECLQAELEIFREIGESVSEAIVLYNLAELHHQMGNLDLAVSDCDRALYIATELSIPLAQDCKKLKERLLNEQVGRNDPGNR